VGIDKFCEELTKISAKLFKKILTILTFCVTIVIIMKGNKIMVQKIKNVKGDVHNYE